MFTHYIQSFIVQRAVETTAFLKGPVLCSPRNILYIYIHIIELNYSWRIGGRWKHQGIECTDYSSSKESASCAPPKPRVFFEISHMNEHHSS